MPYFYFVRCSSVKGRLKSFVAHLHLRTAQIGHDSALADSSVTDHEDGLGRFVVVGDGFQAVVDHLLEFGEVDGIGVTFCF